MNILAPVNDLSAMSKTGSENQSTMPGIENHVAIAGGQILGDEYSDHVVKVTRSSNNAVCYCLIDSNRIGEVSSFEKGEMTF